MSTSCREENVKYTYYKNGNIRDKTDIDNNTAYSYYESGKVKFITGIKGDKLHGKFIRYYESGIVEDSGYYNDGNQYGTWYYFKKSGALDKTCNYVFVYKRGNLLNEIVFYDKNGDTLHNKGHHFRIESINDTINLNDTFQFKIIIEESFFNDSSSVLIRNYDSIYFSEDTTNFLKFDGKNNEIDCSINNKKLGENIVRGIIFDYTFRNDSDLYRELFFSKKFYVKP